MLTLIFAAAFFSSAASLLVNENASLAQFLKQGYLTHMTQRQPSLEPGVRPIEFAKTSTFKDHNGQLCNMCGLPDPSRLAQGTKYTEFRSDCGETRWDEVKLLFPKNLFKPVHSFSRVEKGLQTKLPMNGFCELNMQKSCADAIVNKDYMYYAKSINVFGGPVKTYDWSYCALNGWLEKDVVKLAHSGDFKAMQKYASDQCNTKYAVYNWRKMTLAHMAKFYTSGMMTMGKPNFKDANSLGAWNCAMGDAACDMTFCAYTFCNLGDGKERAYEECPGWDPIKGMKH